MRFILLILVFTASLSAQSPKRPLGVPSEAKYHDGKWYVLVLEKVPWNRAREKCAAKGGMLAMASNAETWQFLKELIGDAAVWLGGNDEAANGIWKWEDGTKFSFTDWFQNQPDNSRNAEHFLATYKRQWNDAPRDGQFMQGQFVVGYVCEWKAR